MYQSGKPPGSDMPGYYYATPSSGTKQPMYGQAMPTPGSAMPVSMPGTLYSPHGSSLTSPASGLSAAPQGYSSMRPQPPNGVQGYPSSGYPQGLASSSYGVPAGMYPATYPSTTLAPTQPAFLTAHNQSSYASARVPATAAGYYGTYNPASRMYGYPGMGSQMTSPTYPISMAGYGAPMPAPLSTYPPVAPVAAGGMAGIGGASPMVAAAAAYQGASPYGRPIP